MDYIKSLENTVDLKFTYLPADRPLLKQALTYAFSFLCHQFKEMRISEMDQAPRAMHRATLALGFLIELALGHPITKASECFLGADAMLDRTMCHLIEQTRGDGLFHLSLSRVELAKDLANLAEGLIIPYMKWRISQGEPLENLTLFFAKWILNRFGEYLWTPECRPWLLKKPSNYDRCNDIVEEITAASCDAMRQEQHGHRPNSSDTYVMGGIAHHLLEAREAMAKLKHMKHLKEITTEDWNPDGTHSSMLKLHDAYASVLSEVHLGRQQTELFLLGLFYWTLEPIGSMAMFEYLGELHLEAVHPGAAELLCDVARDTVFAVFDRIEELYDQADVSTMQDVFGEGQALLDSETVYMSLLGLDTWLLLHRDWPASKKELLQLRLSDTITRMASKPAFRDLPLCMILTLGNILGGGGTTRVLSKPGAGAQVPERLKHRWIGHYYRLRIEELMQVDTAAADRGEELSGFMMSVVRALQTAPPAGSSSQGRDAGSV